jgi:CelD/BcsL family acetyltransferase involved in cellulose biosynthesis
VQPPPAATSQLVLRRVTDVPAALSSWSSLAERSGNPFATPEWLLPWWRHFGGGEEQIWLAGDDQGPNVLLPLYLERGVLRFIGRGHSDVVGPVTAPEHLETAGALLRSLLDSGEIEWERFEGEDLPGDARWARLLGAEARGTTASPVLRLQGLDWGAYLASRGKHFRSRAVAAERRLSARGARVRVSDAARLEDDLEALFGLHLARWGPVDASEVVDRGRSFYREIARAFLDRGWLRLSVLEVDGAAAAALLNFRFGGEEWSYVAGRDPRFDRESPGTVLHLHAIRTAIGDGLSAYRFLRGGERYKYRFTDDDAGVVTIAMDRNG